MGPMESKEALYPIGTVHEPDAELLSADDLTADLVAVRAYRQHKQAVTTEQAINLRVPLWAVLDAIKQMDLSALRAVATLTEEQLAHRQGQNRHKVSVAEQVAT